MRRNTVLPFLVPFLATTALVAACSKASPHPTKPAPTTDDTPVAKLPPPEVVAHTDPAPAPTPSASAPAGPAPTLDDGESLRKPGPLSGRLPHMDDGPVVTKGAMSEGRVKGVLHGLTAPFRYCYARALRDDNQVHGSVTVSFTVMRTGIVDGAAVVHGAPGAGEELPDETTQDCLVKAFSSLRFPRQDATTEVTYTLVFAPPSLEL